MNDALTALRNGADLYLSVSGGKDSDVATYVTLERRERECWTGQTYLIHADLGRAEWAQTPDYVRDLARRTRLPLIVTQYTAGDFVDRVWARYHADPTRPCWPSSAARYCTADLKRGPISREIRHYTPSGMAVCVMGLRGEESETRKRKPISELRDDCCSNFRWVWNYLPIHDWVEEEVWQEIDEKASGVCHPAYKLGNHRLSCAMCVLASLNDLVNGATHNPETYIALCEIEVVSGWSFKNKWWLSDLRPELLPIEWLEKIQEWKKCR